MFQQSPGSFILLAVILVIVLARVVFVNTGRRGSGGAMAGMAVCRNAGAPSHVRSCRPIWSRASSYTALTVVRGRFCPPLHRPSSIWPQHVIRDRRRRLRQPSRRKRSCAGGLNSRSTSSRAAWAIQDAVTISTRASWRAKATVLNADPSPLHAMKLGCIESRVHPSQSPPFRPSELSPCETIDKLVKLRIMRPISSHSSRRPRSSWAEQPAMITISRETDYAARVLLHLTLQEAAERVHCAANRAATPHSACACAPGCDAPGGCGPDRNNTWQRRRYLVGAAGPARSRLLDVVEAMEGPMALNQCVVGARHLSARARVQCSRGLGTRTRRDPHSFTGHHIRSTGWQEGGKSVDPLNPGPLAICYHHRLPLLLRAPDAWPVDPGGDHGDPLRHDQDETWKRMTKFWGKLFLINFAMGVVTGIVQEFQFGMNWSEYSRFVGDIFGAPLAIEALLAFFLESTFLGMWIFGWDKLSEEGCTLPTIWLVAIGSNLSALVDPDRQLVHAGAGRATRSAKGRAVMTDFGALVTNPHVWLTSARTSSSRPVPPRVSSCSASRLAAGSASDTSTRSSSRSPSSWRATVAIIGAVTRDADWPPAGAAHGAGPANEDGRRGSAVGERRARPAMSLFTIGDTEP